MLYRGGRVSRRRRGTDQHDVGFFDLAEVVDLELGDIDTPKDQPAEPEIALGSDIHSVEAPSVPGSPMRPTSTIDDLLIAYLRDESLPDDDRN